MNAGKKIIIAHMELKTLRINYNCLNIKENPNFHMRNYTKQQMK